MFLELKDANSFKKGIEGISVLVDEAEFVINQEGMSLKATDPSNISMVSFYLSKEAFSKFEISEETKIGVDLDYLNQISKRVKSGDLVVLALDENKANLLLEFVGKSTRKFKIPLLDIAGQNIPTLNVEFDANVECDASLIQDAIKDAALISNHLIVGVTSDKIYLKANSSKGQVNSEIKKDDLKSLDVKADAQAMFALDYLNDMFKTASGDSLVKIGVKAQAPIKVSYSLGDAELTYFLAPRGEPRD